VPDGADHSYPPALLVESWCQAAGLLAVRGQPNPDVLTGRVTLFGAINDLALLAPVRPGELLVHRVRAVKLLSDAAVLQGETLVDGQVVMTVDQIIVVLRPAGELSPPGGLAAVQGGKGAWLWTQSSGR
jgi:3-hydroxyacyl-[acyl-carrier-protein] dehydratase